MREIIRGRADSCLAASPGSITGANIARDCNSHSSGKMSTIRNPKYAVGNPASHVSAVWIMFELVLWLAGGCLFGWFVVGREPPSPVRVGHEGDELTD